MSKPGIEGETFKLDFSNKWASKNDVIYGNDGYYKIITKPKRVWYKCIFEFLSAGIYKAPWEYIITKEDINV